MSTTTASTPASRSAPFLDILDPAFDFGSPEAQAAREESWYAESPIGFMVAFAEHPDQWTTLAERPELTPQAVEEVIRWRPAAATLFRIARDDFEYRGLRIARDTLLLVCAPIAHRDPRAFSNADSFDITIAREAPTLLFGGGPHYCLGAALARAELGEALPVFASRLGPPSVVAPLSWRGPIGIAGPEALPLTFG